MEIPEAMGLIIELAEKDGISEINKLSGCWEREVANDWKFSVNGHAEATLNSDGILVPPFSALFSDGGFLIGVVNPKDGTVTGDAENQFIEAIQKTLNETPTV